METKILMRRNSTSIFLKSQLACLDHGSVINWLQPLKWKQLSVLGSCCNTATESVSRDQEVVDVNLSGLFSVFHYLYLSINSPYMSETLLFFFNFKIDAQLDTESAKQLLMRGLFWDDEWRQTSFKRAPKVWQRFLKHTHYKVSPFRSVRNE